MYLKHISFEVNKEMPIWNMQENIASRDLVELMWGSKAYRSNLHALLKDSMINLINYKVSDDNYYVEHWQKVQQVYDCLLDHSIIQAAQITQP